MKQVTKISVKELAELATKEGPFMAGRKLEMGSKHVFDRERWAAMTIFEQMGNIGSEVGRALTAKRRGDLESLRGAFYRGLDLFDATAAVWAAKKSPRTTEILRARELFARSVTTDQEEPKLEEYFMQFAIAARLHR